ncbi:MAG: MFS transporter [Rhodospirillaceae bacterium]|nr:MFS transporter [Rhodospirillaceae bacterium]
MPVVLAAVMINAIPVSLVLPMLPYLGQHYGATPFEVSILFTLMPLVGIIGNPLWGRVSDKLGRRTAMTCTLIGTAVAFMAFAFADSLWALFATRALQGVFHGSNSIALAFIADNTPPKERAKGMGYVFGSMGAGLAIGPSLGGFFMSGATGGDFDHFLPCMVAGGLSLLAGLVVLIFMRDAKKDPAATAGPGKPKPKADFRAIFKTPALLILTAMIFASGFKFNSEQLLYPFWGMSVGWSASQTSYFYSLLSLGFLVTSFGLVGFFTKRFGDEKTVLIASCTDLVCICLFIIFAGSQYAFGLLWMVSFSAPLWGTVLASVISRHAPEGYAGVIQGVTTSTQLSGRIVGTLLAGALTQNFGFRAMYGVLVVLLAFIVFQAWRFVKEGPKQPAVAPSQPPQGKPST